MAFLWIAALLFTVTIGAGFSDGIDGLTTGLAVAAAGSMTVAVVVLRQVLGHITELSYTDLSHATVVINQAGDPAMVALASACLGFLLLNLPSNWTKGSKSRRLARAYLGDSGALAIGALLVGSAVAAGIDLVLQSSPGSISWRDFIARTGENTGALVPPVRVFRRTRQENGALFRVSISGLRRSVASSPGADRNVAGWGHGSALRCRISCWPCWRR